MHSDGPDHLAARLREAREYLGLSLDLVSCTLAIPQVDITSMESSTMQPTEDQLTAFGKLYRRPLEFFKAPSRRSECQESAEAPLLRTSSDLSEKDVAQLKQFLEFLSGAGPAPEIPQW